MKIAIIAPGSRGDVQDVVQNLDMPERIEKGNFLRLIAQMAKEAERGAVQLAEGSLAACDGVDLILGGIYIGLSLAEKFHLPFLQAYLVPFTPTREFPFWAIQIAAHAGFARSLRH